MRLLFSLLLAATTLSASEITLTESGAAKATIVLRADATPVERYAAEELQYHLEAISGARLPIQSLQSEETPSSHAIIITSLQSDANAASALGADPATLGKEEVVIETKGSRLYLSGKTPRAALYATYTFLQDQLGCRWLWPGKDGEYLPTEPTITIPTLSRREQPDLQYRTFGINHPHYDEATDIWMARQRLNVRTLQSRHPKELPEALHQKGFTVAIGGHNVTLPEAVLNAHPEYAAEIAGTRTTAKVGKRQPHLCWSNPELQRTMSTQLDTWINANPFIDALSLAASDHTLFCQCQPCITLSPDPSTRWQLFLNTILTPLKKAHPEKEFWSLAYQAYRDVPKEISTLNNIWYCSYNANHIEPLSDSPTSSPALKSEMQAWKKLGANVSIRGYEFIPFSEPMWTPLLRHTIMEKRWLLTHGMIGASSEIAPRGFPADKPEEAQGWTANRLTLYASAQAMWKSAIEPEALLKDWMETLYGPAAPALERYYLIMEKAWLGQAEPLTYFLHPPTAFAGRFLSPELIAEAIACFNEAEAAPLSERQKAQLNLERRLFERWHTHYQYASNRKARNKQAVLQTPQAPSEDAWAGAPTLPPFEDRQQKTASEPTDVQLLWSDDALHLRFTCHDSDTTQLIARAKTRDGNIFADDSVEIFLQWRDQTYAHLAFNAEGVLYDAMAEEGRFATEWNPEWSVATRRTATSWVADVTLPFSSFSGTTPNEGTTWKAAFKRSRPSSRRTQNPALSNSGWPDASYHNSHAFGSLHFVKTLPASRKVLLYGSGPSRENITGALLKNDVEVTCVDPSEGTLTTALAEKPAAALFIRLHHTDGSQLSDTFFSETLLPYVRNGGKLLLSASRKVPIERWFENPALSVEWSGWRVDPRRQTSSFSSGAWHREPHDLTPALRIRISPASGFLPQSDGWKPLASLRLDDQSECPYLLKASIGKGTLYLTSSAMGYSGGSEIFGRMRPDNVAALIENLLLQ